MFRIVYLPTCEIVSMNYDIAYSELGLKTIMTNYEFIRGPFQNIVCLHKNYFSLSRHTCMIVIPKHLFEIVEITDV